MHLGFWEIGSCLTTVIQQIMRLFARAYVGHKNNNGKNDASAVYSWMDRGFLIFAEPPPMHGLVLGGLHHEAQRRSLIQRLNPLCLKGYSPLAALCGPH